MNTNTVYNLRYRGFNFSFTNEKGINSSMRIERLFLPGDREHVTLANEDGVTAAMQAVDKWLDS